VSDPKPLSPAETMRALLDERLKAAGIDPAEAERRATAAIEAALASVGHEAEPARSNVVPLRKPPARSPSRRWLVLGPVAAAAAVAVTVGVMNGSAIVAVFRGTEPIGPDRYGTPAASTPVPTPAEQALALRTDAFAACAKSEWDWCQAQLDAASQLDPAGESAPEVVEARKAIKKGQDEEERGRKPRLK
jgi:hypothetical protein